MLSTKYFFVYKTANSVDMLSIAVNEWTNKWNPLKAFANIKKTLHNICNYFMVYTEKAKNETSAQQFVYSKWLYARLLQTNAANTRT